MNKVKVYCEECNKKYVLKFNEASELYQQKCKFCGSNDIFYRDFTYDNKVDKTIPKTGDRSCGTPNRFK